MKGGTALGVELPEFNCLTYAAHEMCAMKSQI